MIKLEILKPCLKNWEDMIDYNGYHFCKDCSKNVIDFSSMDKAETLRYILRNREHKVCANLDSGEINFSPNELISVIDKELVYNKKTNYGFYLLLLSALSFASCNLNSSKETEENKRIENSIPTQNSRKNIEEGGNNKSIKTKEGKDTIDPPQVNTKHERFGEIEVQTNLGGDHVYSNPQKLPMYKDGIENMYSFINQNLNYPNWEKIQKIEGRVIVSFIVEKDGSLSDIKVVRAPEKSKNFNTEVIRIIKLMPKWVPAEHDNKKVRCAYYLPIMFKL